MKSFIVPPKGGLLSVVDSLTGEVIFELHLAAGVYPLARFAPLRRAGASLSLPGPVIASSGNALSCKPVGQYESAANPHFRVSPADRQVRQMTRMMRRTEALAKRAEAAQTAMTRAKSAQAQLPAPDLPEADGSLPTV